MKLSRRQMRQMIIEEMSQIAEANTGIGPKGRHWAQSPMTGEKHWGGMAASGPALQGDPDLSGLVKDAILELFVMSGEVRTADVFDHLRMNGLSDDDISTGIEALGGTSLAQKERMPGAGARRRGGG